MDILTEAAASDHDLVSDCLNGNQQAWSQLLDRYKRLIYAVTVRFGLDNEDRHDIFQAVCFETLKSLSSLRNAGSLRYWIITITVRQCWSLRNRRHSECGHEAEDAALAVKDPRPNTMEIFLAAERAEMLQEAMTELPERCRTLLGLLFFAEDRPSYVDLGGRFGWSKDTVGASRQRCLERLRKILVQRGF